MTTVLASEAKLATLQVTIQSLVVNGKQMTLATFRQLPVRRECAESESWGYVRYKIDDDRIWLVHSFEGALYRTPVYEYQNEPRREDGWNTADLRSQINRAYAGQHKKTLEAKLEASIRRDEERWTYDVAEYRRSQKALMLPQLFIAT